MTKAVTNEKQNIALIIFQCIIVYGFIISTNSMWMTLAPYDHLIEEGAVVLILIGFAGSVIASKNLLDKKRLVISLIFTVALFIYLLIFILITDYSLRRFAQDSIVFLALLFYYFLVEDAEKTPRLLKRYEYIVTIIAAVSIICWLIFSVFKLVPPSTTQMTWWNGTDHYTEVASFYGIYFEPQTIKIGGHEIIRNSSIFTEAPMASLHFSLAFLSCLFLRKKTSVVRAAILFVAMLTTFSATGIITCLFALAFKIGLSIFGSNKYKGLSSVKKNLIRIIIAVVIIAVVLVFVIIIKGRVGGLSWRIRVEDFKATFQAWFDKPIAGNGLYNFDAVKAHFAGERATNPGFSCSNSLGTILADGGIMFGLLYIGSFICSVIRSVRSREYNILIFAIIAFIIFSVTIVAYDYIILFIFIFFGAYKCSFRKYLERKLFK